MNWPECGTVKNLIYNNIGDLKIKKALHLIFIALLIFFSSCNNSKEPEPTAVPAVTAVPSIIPKTEESIVLSCIPVENELKIIEGWQLLADYITFRTGIKVTLDTKNSYQELIDGLNDGYIDMCYLGALSYIKSRKKSGVIPLVRPTFTGQDSPFYTSCIIVRKDSAIRNLEELKGKKFAFVDKNSTSGYLLPLTMLQEEGINNLDFFSEYIFTGDHDSSFLAVYNGYVDGGALYSRIFLNEDDARLNDIKVLKESPPIPTGPIVIRKEIKDDRAQKIKEALLSIGEEEDTKDIMALLKIEGYFEVSDSDYAPIRKAYKLMEK